MCYNHFMEWEKATDVILIASLVVLAVFAILGLCQWISRRSLKKVDKTLLFMPIPLAIMAAVYVIFDKFLVIATRPNGSGESSFPSSHVMVVATIFALAAIALPRYIKSKTTCALFDFVMLAMLVLVCVGRVAANMHWITDVIGGLGFAAAFAILYYLLTKKFKDKNE